MTFRIGQKVVCVNVSMAIGRPRGFPPHKPIIPGLDGLTLGEVYTIRVIVPCDDEPEIYLEEIARSYCPYRRREAGFAHKRFRPVVDTKTDISVLTAMLNPSREMEPAQ